MKNILLLLFLLPIHVSPSQSPVHSGISIGPDVRTPVSTFEVQGNMTIGRSWSGEIKAPENGLLIEGQLGIGIESPSGRLETGGRAIFHDTLIFPGGLQAVSANPGARFTGNGMLELSGESSGRVQFWLDSGRVYTDGTIGSQTLSGNGLRPVGADAQGILRPLPGGLQLPSGSFVQGSVATVPVQIQVHYGPQAFHASWELRNSSGQIVASGNGSTGNQSDPQHLAPGTYLLKTFHGTQQGWNGGFVRFIHPSGIAGPFYPVFSQQQWTIQIPSPTRYEAVSAEIQSVHWISGIILPDGKPLAGNGFDIEKWQTGEYKILPREAGPYWVQITPESPGDEAIHFKINVTESEIYIRLQNESGQAVDGKFHFMIIAQAY